MRLDLAPVPEWSLVAGTPSDEEFEAAARQAAAHATDADDLRLLLDALGMVPA